MIFTFNGVRGGMLSIEQGVDSILLTVHGKTGLALPVEFRLNPAEFGSVAAALWECSPTKQPIKITGTPQEDTVKETDEEVHTSEDGGGKGTEHKAAKAGSFTEAASQRTGPGATVDAGTKNAGKERG